jgi:tryptophanyl-tRNA synthetase
MGIFCRFAEDAHLHYNFTMNKQQTLVAGIRASGKLHIGHYLGLVKQLLETQNNPENNCYFFIADLHGITTSFESSDLSKNTLDITATYLALGINPKKVTFFLQNHVLEHATLAWIFNCITPLGELERMTQYKDKSRQNEQNINTGLLTYPCLMAADILLYKPLAVPVGEDQVQHVELSRVIARKFNNKFGKTFPEPQTYLRQPLRIMSLTNPEQKMSKTGDEALNLDDTFEEIKRKLKKAVTASDPNSRNSPGVNNLLYLVEQFASAESKQYLMARQKDGTLQYSELKEILAKDINSYFTDFREKKQELLSKPKYLAEVLGQGAEKARKVASQTLFEVKQKVGLL